jgi:hypothetical protein
MGGEAGGELLGGRYRPLGPLGQGGQGVVERALDTVTDRVVALKIRRLDPGVDRDAVLDEARILLAVPPHPNVALVRADFFEGDVHVLVMDFVDGRSLAVRLKDAPDGLPAADVVRWLADVAAALDHLHGQRPPAVHGDVKPSNIVIAGDRAVLVDFGLAGFSAAVSRAQATAAYAAPEVAGGARSAASDVYSFAATAYALLTGAPPAPGTRGGIDAGVRGALAPALSFDPRGRPPSARVVVDRLAAATGVSLTRPTQTTTARHRPWARWAAIAASATVVAVALVAAGLSRSDPPRDRQLSTEAVPTPTTQAVAPAVGAPATVARRGASPPPSAPVATAPRGQRAAVTVGRLAVVSADGTVDVRRILDGGGVESQRTTAGERDRTTFVARVRTNQLLAYRNDGYAELFDVAGDGAVTSVRREDTNPGFALGTGLDDGWILFYMSDGYAGSVKLDAEGGVRGAVGYNESRNVNGGYDRLVHAGGRRALLYASSSGKSMLVSLGSQGEWTVPARPQLAAGWTVLAPTGRDIVLGLAPDGTASVLRVGSSGVQQVGTAQVGAGRFTVAAPYARGTVVVDTSSGSGRVIEVGDDGRVQRVDTFQIPPATMVAGID